MVMKRVIDDINSVLDTMEPSIRAISEAEFSAKPRQDKWSK
jgi:hypothetical protein